MKITRKRLSVIILVIMLITTNILTVVYYKDHIAYLKQQSSFVTITQNSNSVLFKKCLDNIGVEYKIEDNDIKVREVEQNDAISSCS